MNTQKFSFGLMLSTGWQLFKKHWRFILAGAVATVFVYIILQVLQVVADMFSLFEFVMVLISFLVGIIMTLGWSQVFLGLVYERTVTWDTFKSKPEVWLRYIKTYLWFIGYTFVFSLLTILPGVILGIVGFFTGIYWLLVIGVVLLSIALVFTVIYFSIKYQFLNLAVIEYPELSSRNIFRKTGSITKGHLIQLFLFGVIIGLVNLLGLIVFFVGLFITVPVTKLAQVKMYTHLKELKN